MYNAEAVLFLLILFLATSSCGNTYARFSDIPDSLSIANYKISESQPYLEWYASWPTNFKLVLLGYGPVTVKLNCKIDRLTAENELQEASFCFKSNSHPETCKSLRSFDSKLIYNLGKKWKSKELLNINLSFDSLIGGTAEIKAAETKLNVSFDFYCKVKNKYSILISNTVQLVDFRDKFPEKFKIVTNNNHPLHDAGPSIFPCSKIDVPKDIHIAYTWRMCLHSDITKCKRHSENLLAAVKGSPVQILKNGSLYFPFVSRNDAKLIKQQFIFCKVAGQTAIFYSKRVELKEAHDHPKIESLTITNPSPDGENITLLNSSNIVATYYCNFEGGPGTYSVRWSKHKSSGIPENIDVGYNNKMKVSIMGFGISFFGPFTNETEGKYVCEVIWTPKLGKAVRKSAWYQVSLQYFPEVSPKMASKIYVVSGQDGSVKCRFTPVNVNLSLAINGHPLDLSTNSQLSKSVQSINMIYSRTMGPLTVSVNPINSSNWALIEYTAVNMSIRSPYNNLSTTHQLDCIGSNKLATVRKTILFQMISRLKIQSSRYSSSEDYVFRCVVLNSKDYDRKDSKVVVNQYWKIDTFIDDKTSNYIRILDDNRTVMIKKRVEPAVAELINATGLITCVITLRYPSGMKEPEDLEIGPYMTRVFYSSENDPAMNDALNFALEVEAIKDAEAFAPVDVEGLSPASISAMWIVVAVVIASVNLVVAFTIGGVVILYRRRFTHYSIDEVERVSQESETIGLPMEVIWT